MVRVWGGGDEWWWRTARWTAFFGGRWLGAEEARSDLRSGEKRAVRRANRERRYECGGHRVQQKRDSRFAYFPPYMPVPIHHKHTLDALKRGYRVPGATDTK